MDQIIIRDLRTHGIIGIHPHERIQKQEIRINIVMRVDLSTAGDSDDIHDTVNYQTIAEGVIAIVENAEYFLIERLASHIAAFVLNDYPVFEITVTIDKPQALSVSRSVAVEITRKKGFVQSSTF